MGWEENDNDPTATTVHSVQLELELFNQFKCSGLQIFDDSLTGSNYK